VLTAFKLLFDDEIWEHLAVILAMGISPESEMREYWSETDPWVGNEGISNTCAREQFREWNDIFHFDLDWLVQRCVVNAKAHWRNRQYIKGKPHQNGLKWYLFADIMTICT